jgi:hypothetical protein
VSVEVDRDPRAAGDEAGVLAALDVMVERDAPIEDLPAMQAALPGVRSRSGQQEGRAEQNRDQST